MKMEITVAEALELINEIRKQPGNLFVRIQGIWRQHITPWNCTKFDPHVTG